MRIKLLKVRAQQSAQFSCCERIKIPPQKHLKNNLKGDQSNAFLEILSFIRSITECQDAS